MRTEFGGVVSATVFSLLLGARLAMAQPAPPPGGEGPGEVGRMGREARFLELTEEQVALVGQVVEQQRPQIDALHEQMRENRMQLREALDAPAPDAQTVGELVIQGERLRQQGRTLREGTEKAIEGFLTPEQKRKREMLEAARAVSPSMHGPDGGPGMGSREGARRRRGPR